MKAKDLRERSLEDLVELEKSLAQDVFQNRLKNFTNRLDDTSSMKKARRDLARVKTVLFQQRNKDAAPPAPKAPKAPTAPKPVKAPSAPKAAKAPAAPKAAKQPKAPKAAASSPAVPKSAASKPAKKTKSTKSEAK